MAGATKRQANVPREARRLGDSAEVSKADLLEAAWHLASLRNSGEGVDDDAATLKRLREELNNGRARRGARPLVEALPAEARR